MLSYRKLAMRVLGRPLHTGGIDSPRPASQRAAAFILTAAMLTTLAAPAFADIWHIEDGDITVKASGTEGKNTVSQGNKKDVEDTNTIITNRDKNTASSHTVTIEAGNDKVEVTLDNVNIKADSGSALISKGDVTLTLKGDNHLTGGNGGSSSYGGDGITSSGSLTISGGTVTANGDDGGRGISSSGSVTISGGSTVTANGGSGTISGGDGIWSGGGVTISGGSTVTANGGNGGSLVGGDGIRSGGGLTVSDGTVTAKGGNGDSKDGYGGDGIRSGGVVTISGNTVNAAGGYGGKVGGYGICSFDRVAISGGTVNAAGGNDGNGNYSYGGSGIHSVSGSIDLSGSLELTAKAGSPNGKALSQNGSELVLDTIKDKLGPGAKVTATDANGETKQVSIPRPVEPEESSSSSDGGSATPSAPASPLPGLTVTDKDGQRISYTSTQSGNTLTVCVGRFTASLRISLAALRQLRAEGIETITFQTILCSTTLSVDELLAMGGEDADAVLTHRFTDSSLTVG